MDMDMQQFKYQLGDLVCIDPTGKGQGPMAKVIAVTISIEKSTNYLVSFTHGQTGQVVRQNVNEAELMSEADVKELLKAEAKRKASVMSGSMGHMQGARNERA